MKKTIGQFFNFLKRKPAPRPTITIDQKDMVVKAPEAWWEVEKFWKTETGIYHVLLKRIFVPESLQQTIECVLTQFDPKYETYIFEPKHGISGVHVSFKEKRIEYSYQHYPPHHPRPADIFYLNILLGFRRGEIIGPPHLLS